MSYSGGPMFVDPNPPWVTFHKDLTSPSPWLELARRDEELLKRSDVSLLAKPLQTDFNRASLGAIDELSHNEQNSHIASPSRENFLCNLRLPPSVTVRGFVTLPPSARPEQFLYTLQPCRAITVRQTVTFPAFIRRRYPSTIVPSKPFPESHSSLISIPRPRHSTSRANAYVPAADLAPKKVRFSDQVPNSMASSDNAGSPIFTDPNPPFAQWRAEGKPDCEMSEVETERAAAIDPRTGEPYKYGTPNHHGHAPRVSPYTHFRMVDGMLMNPPPGGRRTSSDESTKDKDKKKVHHVNLAFPGLPSGHRIKVNNPNNDDDAETVAGSIFDYAEKPSLFNPWTSTRMTGLKPGTTTGKVAKAKKEVEATKAKAEAEAREKAEAAAKEAEDARKKLQPTVEDGSDSSLTVEALSRHDNGPVDKISSWKVEPQSEYKSRKGGSDISFASSNCSRASHAALKEKTLALEKIYEKAEQERREERKAFEKELKAREEERKEQEKRYEEERREQAEEHAKLLNKLLAKIDDLTVSKSGNSISASSEDVDDSKETNEKLLHKIEELEKKVDELKDDRSKASSEKHSSKDSVDSKENNENDNKDKKEDRKGNKSHEATGKNDERSTKKNDTDNSKKITFFGNDNNGDTWNGNGKSKGKKNKKGNTFEPFNWKTENDDKDEQKEEPREEPKGNKGSKKDNKKDNKKNDSYTCDDKKDEKKDDKKDAKKDEKKGWGVALWNWGEDKNDKAGSARREAEDKVNNDIPPKNDDDAKDDDGWKEDWKADGNDG